MLTAVPRFCWDGVGVSEIGKPAGTGSFFSYQADLANLIGVQVLESFHSEPAVLKFLLEKVTDSDIRNVAGRFDFDEVFDD